MMTADGTFQEQSVSVVIPTLTPPSAQPCVGAVRGGSSGKSSSPMAARAIRRSPSGRSARQCRRRAAGARTLAAARRGGGDWLLFLHAESRPGRAGSRRSAASLGPGPRLGRLFRFRSRRPGACRAAAGASRRLALPALALPYGDQGLLIARSLYDAVGGFPPCRSWRMSISSAGSAAAVSPRIGARLHLGAALPPRRLLARPLRNLVCLALYLRRAAGRSRGSTADAAPAGSCSCARRVSAGKRRLARGIGDGAALRFDRPMLALLLRRLGATAAGSCGSRDAGPALRGIRSRRLGSSTQGERRSRAGACAGRSARVRPAVLVGCDIPALERAPHRRMRCAGWRARRRVRAAADGGFWLVGARRTPLPARLFGACAGRRRGTCRHHRRLADGVGVADHLDDVDEAAVSPAAPRRGF